MNKLVSKKSQVTKGLLRIGETEIEESLWREWVQMDFITFTFGQNWVVEKKIWIFIIWKDTFVCLLVSW